MKRNNLLTIAAVAAIVAFSVTVYIRSRGARFVRGDRQEIIDKSKLTPPPATPTAQEPVFIPSIPNPPTEATNSLANKIKVVRDDGKKSDGMPIPGQKYYKQEGQLLILGAVD